MSSFYQLTSTKSKIKGGHYEMDYTGKQIIVDLFGCDFELLNDAPFLANLLKTAAIEAGCTVLSTRSHKFEPQGVTAVVILAESHITIHTVPELNKAWLDTFTCGDKAKPEKAVELILAQLKPKEKKSTKFVRH